ncbi:MAG: GTP cyclohydrolase FolE2 [Candidatus Eutrophobiaceae bacterium]
MEDAMPTVAIPDVQSAPDSRQIPIEKVGIKDIRHPIVVKDRTGSEQYTVARFNMYVDLPKDFKGTHMSRFVEILNQRKEAITVDSFKGMIAEMTSLLNARSGHIEMSFPYFIDKAAPVSGVRSLMDYEVTFIGEMHGDAAAEVGVEIIVPVTSLCPCSRDISDYGAHNQRSHITINVRTSDFIWIEELIEMTEQVASCELYGLLKRPDEKYVTERAYDNPKFVEDLVRDVAVRFNEDPRICSYQVESENFESIHNHSAYAMVSCDKENS